jgi:hypothetical protein
MKQARPFVTLRGVASGGGTYDEREKIERGRPERRRPPGAAKQALDYDQALQRWCFIAHLPCIAATSQLFRPTARYLEPGDHAAALADGRNYLYGLRKIVAFSRQFTL